MRFIAACKAVGFLLVVRAGAVRDGDLLPQVAIVLVGRGPLLHQAGKLIAGGNFLALLVFGLSGLAQVAAADVSQQEVEFAVAVPVGDADLGPRPPLPRLALASSFQPSVLAGTSVSASARRGDRESPTLRYQTTLPSPQPTIRSGLLSPSQSATTGPASPCSILIGLPSASTSPPGTNRGATCGSLVRHEMNLAQDVPHDQVAIAVAIPVKSEDRRGMTHLDGLALGILDRRAGGKLAFPQAAKPVDLARPGAGEDVKRAIMIQIHQLWSEADASPRRDGAERTARLEPLVALESRTDIRAQVAVDPQPPFVELANEQVVDPSPSTSP